MADSTSHSVFICVLGRGGKPQTHISITKSDMQARLKRFLAHLFTASQVGSSKPPLDVENHAASTRHFPNPEASTRSTVACFSSSDGYRPSDEQNGDRSASAGSLANERRLRGVYWE